MRVVRVVIVVLVLIIFPLVSWIYLSKGLKWRIGAQQETAVKGTLPAFQLTTREGQTLSETDLLGRFYVMARGTQSGEMEALHSIQEQFGVRTDYLTLFLVPPQDSSFTSTDTTLTFARCLKGCELLMDMLFEGNSSAAIVDDSLHIRGRYVLDDPAQVRQLVKHLAVVLPVSKSEKIELRRGDYQK